MTAKVPKLIGARVEVQTQRQRRFRVFLAACLMASLGFAVSCEGDAGKPKRILLITLDTLRWDIFSGESDTLGAMKALRKFSKTALVFDHHYTATSSTQPTHASLFTGLHPWQHRVPRNGAVLPSEFRTVTEQMKDQGFRTSAVVASFPLHRSFGFDQGFDSYDDDFEVAGSSQWSEHKVTGNFSSHADVIYSKAMQMLDHMGEGNQFLWVHFFDPHSSYGGSVGDPLMGMVDLKNYVRERDENLEEHLVNARKGYALDVRFLDLHLALLLQRLQEDEALLETHIIIVADHGESFGEDGSLGHGKRLTEQQIHVPLLIRSPSVTPGVSHVATGSVDVAATLLAMAGISELTPEGRDLTQPLTTEPPVIGMRRTFLKPYQDLRIDGSTHIIEGGWFYSAEGGRVFKGNGSELIANDSKPIPESITERLTNQFRELSAILENQDIEEIIDPNTQEMLEALGYVR